jgi:hypothetical protein
MQCQVIHFHGTEVLPKHFVILPNGNPLDRSIVYPFASLKHEHSFGPQTFLKTKINTKKQSKIEVQAMADDK